jgi:hypothetical protein
MYERKHVCVFLGSEAGSGSDLSRSLPIRLGLSRHGRPSRVSVNSIAFAHDDDTQWSRAKVPEEAGS